MIAPDTEAAIADAIRTATEPLLIEGNGTKAAMLRPVQASATLSTANLTGITLYAPKELVISAKSGTTLAEIEATLAAAGQHLIAEPSHLFGENQTLGGIIASNLSGPRRITAGATRDHILGIRAINGNGEILKFGGRVLKNVTGLDLCKLLTGSYGTLAVITEITLKILPIPQSTGTILVRNLDPHQGIAALTAGLGSPFSVSAAAYLPDQKTAALRIEDFAPSVTYRTEKLALQLQKFGPTEILDTAASKTLWQQIRDCQILDQNAALWRVSVPPSAGPTVLAAVEPFGATGFLDWGGGLVWLTGPASAETHTAIRHAATAANGVWWLIKAPEPLRAVVDVLPAEPSALKKIRSRVQQSFDPRGIFNPGRMRAA
jgi:glycolate oxidase FAD binding subunit